MKDEDITEIESFEMDDVDIEKNNLEEDTDDIIEDTEIDDENQKEINHERFVPQPINIISEAERKEKNIQFRINETTKPYEDMVRDWNELDNIFLECENTHETNKFMKAYKEKMYLRKEQQGVFKGMKAGLIEALKNL